MSPLESNNPTTADFSKYCKGEAQDKDFKIAIMTVLKII